MRRKTRALTDIEWTTCWMSVRYAYNRESIASTTLPVSITQQYYNRFTQHQKDTLKEELSRLKKETSSGERHISSSQFWDMLYSALDVEKHRRLTIGDSSYVLFPYSDKLYRLDSFIKNPYKALYIPMEKVEVVDGKDSEEKKPKKRGRPPLRKHTE